MTLAAMLAIFIMGFVGIYLLVALIGAFATAGESKPVMPRSGVLCMDMGAFTIGEQSQESSFDPTSLIMGGGTIAPVVGLWDAVQAINVAATDPSIKYLYIKPDAVSAGISDLEELRASLVNFRKSGKAIISYLENPGTGSYYLASVSDKIYMTSHHGGNPTFVGVGGQMYFLKDLLDKLGVNVQLIRHGKYKSAGEMYIRSSASAENMQQQVEMITSVWDKYAADICESREISREDLDSMLNDLKLVLPEDFLENKLVDLLVTKEELKDRLASLAVANSFDDVKFVAFADYVSAKVVENVKAKQKIAVIFADGEITDGSAKTEITGDRYANIISKIRKDESVKAVVLRVNSPGGSVIASDKIKAEIDLLRAEKPVVASYGNYAASGGYWISNSCDKIFSDATTLTGSIGVFSMIPDVSGTLKNIAHVNITAVGSHDHVDMYSLMRPLSDKEKDFMQASVEDIYTQFVSIVSEGRDLTPDFVDSIAQGRVWTGSEGLKLGLVDEIGTLEDAINYAATLAGNADLTAWDVAAYPKPQTTMEMLMESLQSGAGDENVLAGTPFEAVGKELINLTKEKGKVVTLARIPYSIEFTY